MPGTGGCDDEPDFGAGRGWPVIIGVGAVVLGFLLMVLARFGLPAFFRRRPEVAARGGYARPVKG